MPTLETHPQSSNDLTIETFSEAEVIVAPVESPAEEAPAPVEKKK
jgi:hypothetical protein